MKKTLLIIVWVFLLLIAGMSNIQSVQAVSTGFERYKDNECEVYLEYFPIVPFDPYYTDASEEFALRFYIWQHDYWDAICWWCPHGYEIDIYYFCDCGFLDYVAWKRWYPTSPTQNGMPISWSLGGVFGPITLRATIQTPNVKDLRYNYDKYYEDYPPGGQAGITMLHLGGLYEAYLAPMATIVQVDGAGSIGIPNDLAPDHEGHHILIWAHVKLWWILTNGLIPLVSNPREIDLLLGDDDPATTDCSLTVEEGTVAFGDASHLTISPVSGGKTEPPSGTYVYDEGTPVTVTASPYTYYEFNYWKLDGTIVSYNPSYTVTMDSDHTLKAYFVEQIVNLVVEVPQAPEEGVEVWVDDDEYRSPVSITVLAGQHTVEVARSFVKEEWKPGYYYIYTFYKWSDGSEDNPRTVDLTSDTTLTAHYLRSEWAILNRSKPRLEFRQ